MKTESHLGIEHAAKMAELQMLFHRAKQMGNDDGESSLIEDLIHKAGRGAISIDEALTQAHKIINSKQI